MPIEVMTSGRVKRWRKTADDLTDGQAAFLEWLLGDRGEGETQADFARRLGVREQTLSEWKKKPHFLEAWERRMREGAANPQILQDQLRVLNEKALTGDVKAIELYWKLMDRIGPDRHVVESTRSVEDMSDEELASAAENLVQLRSKAG